jgi:hypothetical protein
MSPEQSTITPPKYNAFLSYSHTADEKLVSLLQPALHSFARPWNRRHSLHVFRDRSNLAARGLWSQIEYALTQSEYFLLLASPASRDSDWVQKELQYWCEQRDPSKIVLVLTDGQIEWNKTSNDFDWERTTALPRLLQGKLREEPLHVDFSWTRHIERLSPRDTRFLDGVATIASVLHDRPKDELYSEDIRQLRRRILLFRSGLVAVITLALIALGALLIIRSQRDQIADQNVKLAQTLKDVREKNAQLEAAARVRNAQRLAAQKDGTVAMWDLHIDPSDAAPILPRRGRHAAYRTQQSVARRSGGQGQSRPVGPHGNRSRQPAIRSGRSS